MPREFKIVIEQSGVKRELVGAFRLCLSQEAAGRLRDELKKADHPEWNFGWIDVQPEPSDESQANTPPRKWAE